MSYFSCEIYLIKHNNTGLYLHNNHVDLTENIVDAMTFLEYSSAVDYFKVHLNEDEWELRKHKFSWDK